MEKYLDENNNLFIDIKNEYLKNLNILIGGRGLGKTFSVLKHKIESAQEKGTRFIWLRDSETVIKKIAAGNSLSGPIEAMNPDFPHVVIDKIEENYVFNIKDAEGNTVQTIGYLMALSTFHNARGINYDDVDCIIWDEFIPEEGTLRKKNQGTLFLNMYESVNRNREMEDKPPVQIIFLSNANDIYSEVLEDLGVSYLIEHMIDQKEKEYIDDDIWIAFLSSQKFYDKKKNTFIYRITTNEKFKSMALDNKFNNSMALIKPNIALKGSKGLIVVDNRYTLLQLADGRLYWKLAVYKDLQNYDMNNEQEALLFRFLFSDKLRVKYIAGSMFFDSIYTQRNILDYARM